jgi:hypothetical protein
MDQFYRWVWNHEDGYTANVKPSHADAWTRHLAQTDYSGTHKTNCQKALKMLVKRLSEINNLLHMSVHQGHS